MFLVDCGTPPSAQMHECPGVSTSRVVREQRSAGDAGACSMYLSMLWILLKVEPTGSMKAERRSVIETAGIAQMRVLFFSGAGPALFPAQRQQFAWAGTTTAPSRASLFNSCSQHCQRRSARATFHITHISDIHYSCSKRLLPLLPLMQLESRAYCTQRHVQEALTAAEAAAGAAELSSLVPWRPRDRLVLRRLSRNLKVLEHSERNTACVVCIPRQLAGVLLHQRDG